MTRHRLIARLRRALRHLATRCALLAPVACALLVEGVALRTRPPAAVARILAEGARRGTPFDSVRVVRQTGPFQEILACRGAGAEHGCELWLDGPLRVAPGDASSFARAVILAGSGALGGVAFARWFRGLHPFEGDERADEAGDPDRPRPPACDASALLDRLVATGAGLRETLLESSPPSSYELVYRVEVTPRARLAVERWPCRRADGLRNARKKAHEPR